MEIMHFIKIKQIKNEVLSSCSLSLRIINKKNIYILSNSYMREFKTLTQLYIYVNTTLIYTCISSMPFSDIFIFNATLWYLYLQCHSLISLSSMPFSDIFIFNATLWYLYLQCHSLISLSWMPLWYLYVSGIYWMPRALSGVFILNASLWILYPQCHSDIFIMTWMPLLYVYPQCYSL
jgi:hypothetical protein